MQKRRVEELNVLDDFLFGSIVSYPGIGEKFCRKLLGIILGEDVKSVRIIPQRIYYGNDTDKHGTRLDVCIEGEGPDLPYYDGALTVFLNTRGKKGNPPEELQRLLCYLEDSRETNAVDRDLKELHRMVETVKQDKEVSLEYMKIFEREQMIREEGERKGIEKGIEKGIGLGAQRINELNRRLIRDGRTKEMLLSAEDEEVQRRLLEEYNL